MARRGRRALRGNGGSKRPPYGEEEEEMLIIGIIKAIAMLAAAAVVVALVLAAVWRVVYHVARCRRNPIGKTLAIGGMVLYLASAALLAAL